MLKICSHGVAPVSASTSRQLAAAASLCFVCNVTALFAGCWLQLLPPPPCMPYYGMLNMKVTSTQARLFVRHYDRVAAFLHHRPCESIHQTLSHSELQILLLCDILSLTFFAPPADTTILATVWLMVLDKSGGEQCLLPGDWQRRSPTAAAALVPGQLPSVQYLGPLCVLYAAAFQGPL